MTYTFKLSRRLAGFPLAAVAGLLVLLSACEGDESLAPQSSALAIKVARKQLTIQSISVSPASVTLPPSGAQKFTAIGTLSDGSTTAVSVRWSATGGVVDREGNYRAGTTTGSYRVVAKVGGQLADTADVSISGPIGSVDSVAVKLVLKPSGVTLAPGATGLFWWFGRTSTGDSIPLAASVTSDGGTISSSGLYTAGSTQGTFRLVAKSADGTLSDTSVVTIETSSVGSCLVQSGEVLTLSGGYTTWDSRDHPLAAGEGVDARAAWWTAAGSPAYPVEAAASASGACWHGGKVRGTLDASTAWDIYHSTSGVYVFAPSFTLENVRVDNFGDGVRFTPAGTTNWTARGIWFSNMHDDCIENDRLESGLIEDVLLDGCYVALSARPGNAFQDQVDGSDNTVTVRRSLIRLQFQSGVYKGTSPGGGGFLKIENELTGINLSWVFEDNILLVPAAGPYIVGVCLNPRGVVKSAARNILVYLGSGDYPCPIPAGWTLTRDKAVWDNAMADWKGRHPDVQ